MERQYLKHSKNYLFMVKIVSKQSLAKRKSEPSYFELQSLWGFTKHGGGLKATQELIELCHVDKAKYVLDVGCGVGATSCYIAKRHDCKVVGVDISERMIAQAKERAKRENVKNKVEFRVADVQDLPFKENTFDVVIGESIIAFLEEKEKGITECRRVVKTGGYVGFNEGTWTKKQPPTELIKYMSHLTGAKFETAENWKKLMENSGLEDIVVKTYKLSILSKIDEIKMYGLKDYLRSFHRFLSLGLRSSTFWVYVKEAWPPKSVFKNFFEYFGYGLYVGKK